MSRWYEEFIDVAPGVKLHTAFNGDDKSTTRLAFIAHPLGRLGGCYDDHVVRALAGHLHQKHGYSVVLMNSRGVGGSTGSPSYSAIPEAEDYQALVNHYLGRSKSTQESLFCGYSAGSLSASFCKPVPGVKARYLLISYPLSALWALTLFKSSPFTSALEGTLATEDTPFLSIRGDKDQFTAASKYTQWETRLGELSKTATFVTVEGADHFWSGKQHLQTLLEKVSEWLNQGGDSQ